MIKFYIKSLYLLFLLFTLSSSVIYIWLYSNVPKREGSGQMFPDAFVRQSTRKSTSKEITEY